MIHYGDECRIKHLATMKYLVVEKNVDGSFEVTLAKTEQWFIQKNINRVQ